MGAAKKHRTEQLHKHVDDYMAAHAVKKERIQQWTFDRLVRTGVIVRSEGNE